MGSEEEEGRLKNCNHVRILHTNYKSSNHVIFTWLSCDCYLLLKLPSSCVSNLALLESVLLVLERKEKRRKRVGRVRERRRNGVCGRKKKRGNPGKSMNKYSDTHYIQPSLKTTIRWPRTVDSPKPQKLWARQPITYGSRKCGQWGVTTLNLWIRT